MTDFDIYNRSNMWGGFPQFVMYIYDCTHKKFAVIVHTEPGKIGCEYNFKPFKAKIVKEAYDEADIHYGGKLKDPIPVGTEVTIDTWWMNFYGSYYKIKYNGHSYDVKTTSIEIDMDSFLGK